MIKKRRILAEQSPVTNHHSNTAQLLLQQQLGLQSCTAIRRKLLEASVQRFALQVMLFFF